MRGNRSDLGSESGVLMPELTVVQTFHDDWLVNVQLSDGRVFTFQTEMWPCHLERSKGYNRETQSNMVAAVREARERALDLAERNATPFVAECDAETVEALKDALTYACMAMSDAEFRQAIHR
jgi:hypothetical protein